eukprot:CAMPEP_0197401734 /NCGR_PEP_ID=MMETSP1165-20131217/18961_1 /TAXON_ID=284809 /ORGANISM="Chrysocystis fragilis, Strain CCMP3189" /LENGTH=444 /DNA_ID=CAMNT_0042927855 /DNA_START=35 /DNA_END=1367 /DNA_ORIENTATION=-
MAALFRLASATSPVALGAASLVCVDRSARPARLEEGGVPLAKAKIEALIEKTAEERGDGTSIGPTLVRLAWHSAGTYAKADKSGGSEGGRMKYDPEASWGANAGLAVARAEIEKISAETGISRADAYTLSGVVAVAAMGGPEVPWRSGRSDAPDGSTSPPDGRLPNADMGTLKGTVQHLRDIFHRMGFDDREIVALSGAHALGRCHTEASGYWGPWTNAETTFSNDYFVRLLEEPWTLKTTHNGKPWTGPDQFETPDGQLMMLPSDLALIWDKKFRAVVEEYAKDEDKFFADFAAAFAKLLELGCNFKPAKSSGFLAASASDRLPQPGCLSPSRDPTSPATRLSESPPSSSSSPYAPSSAIPPTLATDLLHQHEGRVTYNTPRGSASLHAHPLRRSPSADREFERDLRPAAAHLHLATDHCLRSDQRAAYHYLRLHHSYNCGLC